MKPDVGRFENGVGKFYVEDTFQGEAHSRPLPLDKNVRHPPLGAGVLARCGNKLGDQLDYGFHEGKINQKTRVGCDKVQ